jgi:hypothetical protein
MDEFASVDSLTSAGFRREFRSDDPDLLKCSPFSDYGWWYGPDVRQ